MAQAYLFVHFREKTTPDGEQVYFGISRDGFHWEAVNDGVPGAGQGYVPFVADSLASGKFVRSAACTNFGDTLTPIFSSLLSLSVFVLMLPSRSHTATSMERFFRLQRRITSGSKTMTGQITDISKIAVRLMGFSYKKNCGRLPFGEVPAAVLFRFSFPTKPIRFLFVLADSTFSADW